MYYITCEVDCLLAFLPECNFVRELPPSKVWGTYCCRPSEVIRELPRRLVISIEHGIYSRTDLMEVPGVIRVRTVDIAFGGDCCHMFC